MLNTILWALALVVLLVILTAAGVCIVLGWCLDEITKCEEDRP